MRPDRQKATTMPHSDEDAIRELEHRFNAAWDAHDPDALAEPLVDDAQFITVNGAWTVSRAGFRDLMQRLHGATGPYRSSTRRCGDARALSRACRDPAFAPGSAVCTTRSAGKIAAERGLARAQNKIDRPVADHVARREHRRPARPACGKHIGRMSGAESLRFRALRPRRSGGNGSPETTPRRVEFGCGFLRKRQASRL